MDKTLSNWGFTVERNLGRYPGLTTWLVFAHADDAYDWATQNRQPYHADGSTHLSHRQPLLHVPTEDIAQQAVKVIREMRDDYDADGLARYFEGIKVHSFQFITPFASYIAEELNNNHPEATVDNEIDSFGIGAPGKKSTKAWEPDEINPDIDTSKRISDWF